MPEYLVGRYYLVPCVEGVWCERPGVWPVMGPQHEDREIIGFPEPHWHVHPQFVIEFGLEFESWGVPRWANAPIHSIPPAAMAQDQGDEVVFLGMPSAAKYVGLRRRKCRREMPKYPGEPPWRRLLSESLSGSRINLDRPVCPTGAQTCPASRSAAG